ncbi:hypothetical protein BDV95DRAFT_574318 [Massariosphaeria phaeospora]|uniref:Secreted protein n=1 Tax=Massariosphaeria phaeospora TaxID=100035 RepID=A0A7C8I4J3_9PLEO|nr:hypothetical protein BDV95DRAFT_574318 [Massariosphaeria phaeospora]
MLSPDVAPLACTMLLSMLHLDVGREPAKVPCCCVDISQGAQASCGRPPPPLHDITPAKARPGDERAVARRQTGRDCHPRRAFRGHGHGGRTANSAP